MLDPIAFGGKRVPEGPEKVIDGRVRDIVSIVREELWSKFEHGGAAYFGHVLTRYTNAPRDHAGLNMRILAEAERQYRRLFEIPQIAPLHTCEYMLLVDSLEYVRYRHEYQRNNGEIDPEADARVRASGEQVQAAFAETIALLRDRQDGTGMDHSTRQSSLNALFPQSITSEVRKIINLWRGLYAGEGERPTKKMVVAECPYSAKTLDRRLSEAGVTWGEFQKIMIRASASGVLSDLS